MRELVMPMWKRRLAIAPWMLICNLLWTGCGKLEVRDRWFDADRIADVPAEVLPIWTDTVLHQPGQPGIRGFGGRVYFYEEAKPDPVRVDGQLACLLAPWLDGATKGWMDGGVREGGPEVPSNNKNPNP